MRTLLVLGRVSNLPTVWSNCLAAWVLGGGGGWNHFLLVCLGATLLYTGGMFLNDAVDVSFDRRFRPERPIVSGQISARAVWILSVVWLAAGLGVFLSLEKPSIFAVLLLCAIVVYDVAHKRTKLAPFLMAACLFLLYLAGASACHSGVTPAVLWSAAALASYILGISFLARGESTGERSMRWTLGLLFVPAIIAMAGAHQNMLLVLVPKVCQIAWLLWCLGSAWAHRWLPQGVGGLLAGIVLVDWLAIAGQGFSVAFACLFLLALLLQRIAPAT